MLREKSSKYLLKTICEWSHKTILLSKFSSNKCFTSYHVQH